MAMAFDANGQPGPWRLSSGHALLTVFSLLFFDSGLGELNIDSISNTFEIMSVFFWTADCWHGTSEIPAMGNVASGCWPHSDAREECDTDEGASNKVELAASLLFTLPGLASAYHTSVVVNGEEFFFSDSGIFSNMSLTSHQSQPSEKLQLGFSKFTGQQLMRVLQEHFRPGTYDLVRKNCNSFSDCALYFLLGKRLASKYSALESMGQRASLDLLQTVLNNAYQPNQAATNFSVDSVIKHLDRLDKSKISNEAAASGKQALKSGAMVIANAPG
eukprot:s736_g8.t1